MEKKELVDKIIKFIRKGNLSGSFSDGCDCEKCDKYEREIRKKLNRLLKK